MDREKKFICENCGFEIRIAQIQYYEPVGKEVVIEAQRKDNYDECFFPSGTDVEIQNHPCDNPKFSPKDEALLIETVGLPEDYVIDKEKEG